MESVAVLPESRVAAAQAHYKALLKNAKFSLDQMRQLIQPRVPDARVAELLARLRGRDFTDVVEERTEVKEICGMPNCATSIAKTRDLQLVINPLKMRVERNAERGKYCSTRCFEKATAVSQALDNSLPLSRTDDQVAWLRGQLQAILATHEHDLAAVYGDAKEAAALRKRNERLRAEAEVEKTEARAAGDGRSAAARAKARRNATSKAAATAAVAATSTAACSSAPASPPTASGGGSCGGGSTSTGTTKAPDTLQYLAEEVWQATCASPSYDDSDDSDDFEVDGGVGGGTGDAVRAALRLDWFVRMNVSAVQTRTIAVHSSTPLWTATAQPHHAAVLPPPSARASAGGSGSGGGVSNGGDTGTHDLQHDGRPNARTDMSDLYARLESCVTLWTTQRTAALLEAAAADLSESSLSGCEQRIAEFERRAATGGGDAMGGVQFGPVDHQRRAVLQKQLSLLFAQCNFTLVHRRSGAAVDAHVGPRIMQLVGRSLYLGGSSARPLPGLQPAHWHMLTMAFLTGAGFKVQYQSTPVAAEQFRRIQQRCKLHPWESRRLLSVAFWDDYLTKAAALRP